MSNASCYSHMRDLQATARFVASASSTETHGRLAAALVARWSSQAALDAETLCTLMAEVAEGPWREEAKQTLEAHLTEAMQGLMSRTPFTLKELCKHAHTYTYRRRHDKISCVLKSFFGMNVDGFLCAHMGGFWYAQCLYGLFCIQSGLVRSFFRMNVFFLARHGLESMKS